MGPAPPNGTVRNGAKVVVAENCWVYDTLISDYITALSLFIITSSTAQGGGGSFKNRKPIGELGCCEWGMAERSHWWTERCLRSPLFLSLSLTIYLPTRPIFYVSIYLSIYLSLSFSLLSNYLSTYLPIYLPIYPSIYLSISLSVSPFHLSIYLSIDRSIYCCCSCCCCGWCCCCCCCCCCRRS